MNLEDFVKGLHNPTNYVIDIGSSFCAPCDPLYNFITSNSYRGVCIEGNRQKAIASKDRISKDFIIVGEYVKPDNVLDMFKILNVPTVFDMIKIDIDGYDLELVKTILQEYKPSIVIMEYNEKIPPPIKFEVKYKSDYAWDTSHFYGFSIAKGEEEFSKLNYSFYDIYDINNLVFINNEVIEYMHLDKGDINLKYEEHYKFNLNSKKSYPWNSDVEYWQNIRNHNDLKNEIIEYYEKNIPNKNYKKLNDDFTCE
jgi:hypothetical protein